MPGGTPAPENDFAARERATGDIKEEAETDAIRKDTLYRGIMLGVVCVLFIALNVGVFYLLDRAFNADHALATCAKPPSMADRLVTPKVLMTLIGATAVQTGVGFITIVSYLFPKGRRGG